MTEYEIIERTAAGVRALKGYKYPLDGFVAANCWETNMASVCGKPIWFVSEFLTFRPYSDYPCPLFPVFADKDYESKDTACIFAEAFFDFNIKEAANG